MLVFSQKNNQPVALGLPGDNLNLYAVLEVFQKSPTLEGFEKSLNDKGLKTEINRFGPISGGVFMTQKWLEIFNSYFLINSK